MNTETHILLIILLEYVLLLLEDNVDNFQIAKVQPQGVA